MDLAGTNGTLQISWAHGGVTIYISKSKVCDCRLSYLLLISFKDQWDPNSCSKFNLKKSLPKYTSMSVFCFLFFNFQIKLSLFISVVCSHAYELENYKSYLITCNSWWWLNRSDREPSLLSETILKRFWHYICLVWFDLVLWHIYHCRLFNAKYSLYMHIRHIYI